MFTNEYQNISGFERYQINIEPKIVIQPSFQTENGKLWSGTHYIVGGSYEDLWGVGYFIETLGRTYIPVIFNNFLVMYSTLRNTLRDIFMGLELSNRLILYYPLSSVEEMEQITNLYSQFNFSHQSLYTVGHSISATAFKGLSYFNDIQGISFEGTEGENNANLRYTDKKMQMITYVYIFNYFISNS